MVENYDVVVVGGGPAGLMAASRAAASGHRVLLAEKMEKPARKLRITGKGRCNVTNRKPQSEFLAKVKSGSDFFASSFCQFSNNDTLTFFDSIGVKLATERGDRVFPESGKAWDVADGMVRWAKTQGVDISCFTRITEIEVKDSAIISVTAETDGKVRKIACSNVIIATGGVSYPATGSTGDGYTLAHNLGHTIEPIRPSLVPLEIECRNLREIKGLLLKNVSIKLIVDDETLDERFGEMEFYEHGVLGAIVLQISRLAVDSLLDNRHVQIDIDLKPALSIAKLLGRIDREIEALPGAKLRVLMQKLMPSALIPVVAEKAKLSDRESLKHLDTDSKKRLAETIKALKFEITDFRPFTEAIVTAGGVACDEIDAETLESKLIKGLYFAGEVIDIDADTGGYNIQIALSTGHVAGGLKNASK